MQSKPRLLINRTGALGDVILTTPIIRKLYNDREGFCEISIRTKYPIVFKNNKYINCTYPGNENISLNDFDLILNLDLAYEHNPSRHILDVYGFYAFGNIAFNRQCELFSDVDDCIISNKIASEWPNGYIVIHMRRITNSNNRNIPEDFWLRVVTGLLNNTNLGIIQIGMESEIAFGGHSRLIDMRGQLSIHQLREVINTARCFVGVDSAPFHVAATTSTNMVVLFTTAKAEYRKPFREHGLFKALIPDIDCYGCIERLPLGSIMHSCIRGDEDCVNRFNWETALKEICELSIIK